MKDVVPGLDAANLIPFGGGPLLRDWYGEPYILQTVLNDYPREESSSEAEKTLYTASRTLAPLAGTKAIVMVTDAATDRYPLVWDQLGQVQPRIFGLGVGSQGSFSRNPAREQDLMQDWSRVNGGYYAYLQDAGQMETAFDRASAMLRRPAGYTLAVESSYKEMPGPGTLTVVAKAGESSAGGAIELILDASGSMLQRMDGKRRIVIAKEVLIEAVNQHIPAGTPVALRVFGHKEPSSCRTDLEIALKPLDPAAASATIGGVNAMNLAKTPIAASLAMIESDLKQAPGRKVIVLVTDGEETCDGDPELVMTKLRDKGFAVTLNIVGFAIDDALLESQFRNWAELGGGRYFSANDQQGLSQSLKEALRIPYSVYDQNGSLVAEGMVNGAPLELAAGYYRVTVATSPRKTFDRVEIAGAEKVVLETGGGGS
jgi:VWA domain-containing protein